MSNLVTNKSKQFSIDQPQKLVVENFYIIDFSKCKVKDYPKGKDDFEHIIEALSKFSNHQLLEHNNHKLNSKGTGKNSAYIQNLIHQYKIVRSVDVYQRNGHKGKYRLLYTPDNENATHIYILDCFIDDH